MRPHKKLELWKFVIEFVGGIYELTKKFPGEEKYGLISQIKRAAISVASNIAEGAARKSAKEKTQFFSISKGSLSEIDAQLEIALHLKVINEEEYNTNIQKLERISRMLQGLINHYEKT
ncbi:MAG: four helix bundle protein [Elusimicrobia bacterium]|nr:four helix bundle protein [Elusimicrobiota bacterium]